MNRRLFLQCAATGLIAPSVFAVPPVRYRALSGAVVNPFRTWNFADGIPSIFKHNGTWSISSGKLVNTPILRPELIVNGGFDTASDWNLDAGWAISGGVLNCTASATAVASQSPLSTQGHYYGTLTIATRTAGTIIHSLAGNGSTYFNTTGSKKYACPYYNANTVKITTSTGSLFAGTIDNVSCKEIIFAPVLCDLKTSTALFSASISAISKFIPVYVVFNYVDSLNYGIALYNGYVAQAFEIVAGVFTRRLSATVSEVTSCTISVEVSQANSVTVSFNGTPQTPWTLASALRSGTQWGLFSTDVLNAISSCTISKV